MLTEYSSEQTPADYRTIANALATIRQIGAQANIIAIATQFKSIDAPTPVYYPWSPATRSSQPQHLPFARRHVMEDRIRPVEIPAPITRPVESSSRAGLG